MNSIPLSHGRMLAWTRPLVMGIINCTPDSFAVRHPTPDEAVDCARCMIAEGADLLDIGGESTRPGSQPVSAEDELARVLPVIEQIRRFSDIPISVDTTKALVAEKALTVEADMVNDISALAFDPGMADIIARYECPVVLMHIKGVPRTMQDDPQYEDVIGEVSAYFAERIRFAESRGIAREKIILDVGIGFGKRTVDNVALISRLAAFQEFGRPLLVGLSRKRFIGDLTGAAVDDRRPGSLASAALAVSHGANIIRTHDVAATRQAVTVAAAIREA
jgi:dihydropteroate synthase